MKIAWIILLFIAGCASTQNPRGLNEAALPADVSIERWSYDGHSGRLARSPHYNIHSTIEDEEFLAGAALVMEGALTQYRLFAPDVAVTDRPMDCYLFARRPQWAEFTRRHTGNDATIYLQINRGGYTVRDWYVAYFIGDVGTYSVAAHEGWHQFVARYFKGRLPPFLEEGAACMFENISWSAGRPRWNLSTHPTRLRILRHAIENKSLWPLERMISMHAGDVVGQPGERIEAFYAQSWAFMRFMWDADGGKHRPALRRLMNDTAAGTVVDASGSHRRLDRPWNPAAVRPILEHYLAMSLPAIDREYQIYIRKLARD